MKKFTIKLVGLIIVSTTLLTACSSSVETEEQPISRGQLETEVQVFEIGREIPELYLEKSASSNSESIVKVSPQISGKVTNVNVKVGAIVKKGEVLITLGDSLNTDLVDLQYQTAQQANQLSEANKVVSQYAGDQTVDAAQIGITAAYNAYQNAIKSKDNTIALFQVQYDNSLIEVENAELSYDNARENLNAAEDTLNDTEYDLDDLRDRIRVAAVEGIPALEATEKQLESTIKGLESQVRNAELAADIAKNRVTQAEIGVAQLSETYRSQFSQLNAGIQNAITQYNSAINQLESAEAAARLQAIGAESQSVQSQSAVNSAKISRDQKIISAPIEGKITAVNVEAGNMVAPGQVIIQIENDQILTISTSVNANEAKFIRYGDTVLISHNEETFEGTITAISPTLNPISKKVDIEIEVTKVRALPTGEFFRVALTVHPQNTFFVPLNSIFLENGTKHVRTIENNKVKYQEVSIGEIIGNYAEITMGVKPGDKVITTVEKFLKEGEKVTTK